MIVRILLLFIALFTFGVQAQAIKESYSFAVLGEPRYAFNFNHFDYVNPAAPKGGQITLSALGTFDNFNRYALLKAHAMLTIIPGWRSLLIRAPVFMMVRPLLPAM